MTILIRLFLSDHGEFRTRNNKNLSNNSYSKYFFNNPSRFFIVTLITFCFLVQSVQGADINERIGRELAGSELPNTTDNQLCSSLNNKIRRFILLVGATESGKSSFINTIINSQSKPTGKSRNSITRSVEIVNSGSSKLLYPDDPSGSTLFLIDTPGFFFNDLSINNDKILEDIKDACSYLNAESLDAVFIFDSAVSDFYSITSNLLLLIKIFGEKIIWSSLGITTKWDLLSPKALDLVTLSYKNPFISLVKWINDNGKQSLNSTQKSSQIQQLSNSIKPIVPYKLQNLCAYNTYLASVAIKLQSNDTNRYISKVISVSNVTNTSYIEKIYTTSCQSTYKDTSSIEKRALSLQSSAGTHLVKKTRLITLNATKSILVKETRYTHLENCSGFDCLKFLDTRKYCIDHFIALKYDGRGGVFIAGADTTKLVHTTRTDCGDYYQGWVKVLQFDSENKGTLIISIAGTGNGITCKGSVTWSAAVENSTIFTDCAWGIPGAQFPEITVNATVFSYSGIANSSISLSDYRQYCIDHFIAIKYDGKNSIFLAGAEPSQNIHTNRNDCKTFYQGWVKIFYIDTTGLTNFNISHSGQDPQLTCKGSSNFEVGLEKTVIHKDCAWGFSGAQFPFIKVNVTAKADSSVMKKNLLSDNRQHCIDHFIALKYNGNGSLYLSGAGADQQLETSWKKCESYAKDWVQIQQFDVKGLNTINLAFSSTPCNVTCSTSGCYKTGCYDKICNASVDLKASESWVKVFTDCGWDETSPVFPFIQVNVSFIKYEQLSTSNIFNDSNVYCIDHFIAIKYDGKGQIFIAGAEPSLLIHTQRSDCGSYFQGWKKAIQFNPENAETLIINYSGTDPSLTCAGSANWSASEEQMKIFTDCSWYFGGAQFPLINLNVEVVRIEEICKKPVLFYSEIPLGVNFTYQSLEEFDSNEYYPIEIYKAIAILEKSEVSTSKEETKYKIDVTKVNQTVQVERYDLDYYVNIARNQMVDQYRKQIIQ